MITTDAIGTKYDTLLDRESAEEILEPRRAEAAAAAAAAQGENRRGEGGRGAGEGRCASRKREAASAASASRSACSSATPSASKRSERERRAPPAKPPSRRMADKMIQSAGRVDRQLRRPPARQPAAARHSRRAAPGPLMDSVPAVLLLAVAAPNDRSRALSHSSDGGGGGARAATPTGHFRYEFVLRRGRRAGRGGLGRSTASTVRLTSNPMPKAPQLRAASGRPGAEGRACSSRSKRPDFGWGGPRTMPSAPIVAGEHRTRANRRR